MKVLKLSIFPCVQPFWLRCRYVYFVRCARLLPGYQCNPRVCTRSPILSTNNEGSKATFCQRGCVLQSGAKDSMHARLQKRWKRHSKNSQKRKTFTRFGLLLHVSIDFTRFEYFLHGFGEFTWFEIRLHCFVLFPGG